MAAKLGAMCSLDCAECPAHLVYLKDDPALRKTTAEKWTKEFGAFFDPETFFCSGCKVQEGPHTGYCGECPLRNCDKAASVANCGLCDDYRTCDKVRGFLEMAKNLKPALDAIAAGR